MNELREVDRPFQVVSILNNEQNFHSGHLSKESADMTAKKANEDAILLDIKTRYKVIEFTTNIT